MKNQSKAHIYDKKHEFYIPLWDKLPSWAAVPICNIQTSQWDKPYHEVPAVRTLTFEFPTLQYLDNRNHQHKYNFQTNFPKTSLLCSNMVGRVLMQCLMWWRLDSTPSVVPVLMRYLLSMVHSCLVMLSTMGSGLAWLAGCSMSSIVMCTMTDQSPRIGWDTESIRCRRHFLILLSYGTSSSSSLTVSSFRPGGQDSWEQ